MILEGVVTTQDADGVVNIAPMGPLLAEGASELSKFVLRPFQSSRTFANLDSSREGVFHVTDDVLLLAQATLGAVDVPLADSQVVGCPRLADCCRYYEFRITQFDDREARSRLTAQVVHGGRVRNFFGFNRAKHAVLEAAILASRVGILPGDDLRRQLEGLAPPVEKTGGPAEREAFELLKRHIRERIGE